MINHNDMVACSDCGRKMAMPPATICELCQCTRLTQAMEVYHQSARVIRLERRESQKTLKAQVFEQKPLI